MASNRNEKARKGKLTGGRTRWRATRWDNGLGRSRWCWGCSPPGESDGDGLCLANLVGTRAPLFWDRRTAARSTAGVTRECMHDAGGARTVRRGEKGEEDRDVKR